MNVITDAVNRSLPDQASTVVAFFAAIPLTIAGANILGVPTYSIFYFALGSVIISTIFAFFSYFVPRPIRARTTIISFLVWFFLFLAFAKAGIGFKDKMDYGFSIWLTIGLLLILVGHFFFSSIFEELSSADGDDQSYHAKEILITGLVYTTVVLCLVALIAIPITIFLANPTVEKVLTFSSALHVGVFGFWLLTAALVSIYQN